MALDIVKIEKRHNRKAFDCESAPLNLYLQNIAKQHSEKELSRTWVLVDDIAPNTIIGFYTIAISEIDASSHIKRYKQYPHPLPVVRLARLAIDKKYHRKGFSKLLLVDASKKTVAISNDAGSVGIVVDAKNAEAQTYYEQFDFVLLQHNDDLITLFLSIDTCRQTIAQVQR